MDSGPVSIRSADPHRDKSARELGATLVLALHRLLKVSQIHALDNMAVVQQLDQSAEALRIFCSRVQGPATFLFAKNTVFVSGQLLKASRTEYDAALELGAMLASIGATEVVVQPDVENSDLRAFAEAVIGALRQRGRIHREPSPRIRLRRVDAAALLQNEEELPNDEQMVRAYAQAIVVMRRVMESLVEGRWELPHEAKRIAQKLVMLSEGDTPSFLGVTAMRNANHDAAGRAVNASILAVSMCRLLTEDLGMLARVAMAALLHDVGKPYVLGPMRGHANVRLSEDEEARMPGASAFVHTLLGGFRLPSMMRTVIGFEAHWHARPGLLGPVHGGERTASLASRIVATAHRFNALLTPDPASPTVLTPDEAVLVIEDEAVDSDDRAVAALLVGAIGLFPTGTVVELSSGERGVVAKSPAHPADYVRPLVRIVYRADGRLANPPFDLDLREDPKRVVTRVETLIDEHLANCREELLASRSRPRIPRSAQRRALFVDEPAPSTQPSDTERRGVTSSAPPTPRLAIDSAPPSSSISGVHGMTVPSPPPRRDSDVPSSLGSGVRPAGMPSTMPSMPAVRPHVQMPSVEVSVVEPPSSERTPSSISAVFSLITKNVAATARGTLAKTPFAHLLVYVLDQRSSGTLVLTPPEESGIEHAVYFEHGAPIRVWTPAGVAPLEQILLELGWLTLEQLEGSLLGVLSGNEPALETELLRSGIVQMEQVMTARAHQLRRGVEFLFRLPRTTEYAFFADVDLVQGNVGSVPGRVPPLHLLTQGIRRAAEDAVVVRVLERLGAQPLSLVPGLREDAFGFDLDEAAVFGAVALAGQSFADLTQNPLLDPAAVRRVLYLLLLTRSLIVPGAAQRTPIGNPPSSR